MVLSSASRASVPPGCRAHGRGRAGRRLQFEPPQHQKKLGVPAAPGLVDALDTIFSRSRPVEMDLEMDTIEPHGLAIRI